MVQEDGYRKIAKEEEELKKTPTLKKYLCLSRFGMINTSTMTAILKD
jgi:hypothetical protein